MGTKEVKDGGPCATCNRPHVIGIWWPRHPFKPHRLASGPVQVDPKELDARGNNDGRYPCAECGERVMFAIPRGDRPTCGDCLEGRTPYKQQVARLVQTAANAVAEVERLRRVIRTGGAMYRMERACMGVPGGHDPDQARPDGVKASVLERLAKGDGDEGFALPLHLTTGVRTLTETVIVHDANDCAVLDTMTGGVRPCPFDRFVVDSVNAAPAMARELLELRATVAHQTQLATRWQAFCEGRLLAAVQVLLCQATGQPHGSTMTSLQIVEDMEERILHAASKGPPPAEAPHTCPDDDQTYPDTCAGCAAEAAHGAA